MMRIDNALEYCVVDSVDNDGDAHVYERMTVYHSDRERHWFGPDYRYSNQIDDEDDWSYEQEILHEIFKNNLC